MVKKSVSLIDLVKSFPTRSYLQTSASTHCSRERASQGLELIFICLLRHAERIAEVRMEQERQETQNKIDAIMQNRSLSAQEKMARIAQLKNDFAETQELINEKARLIAADQNAASMSIQMQQNMLGALVERAQKHANMKENPPTEAELHNAKSYIDNQINEAREFLNREGSSFKGNSLLQIHSTVDAFSNAQYSLLNGAKEAEVQLLSMAISTFIL